MTMSGNVDNKNYGSSINPSEIEPKPTSPDADGTQVTLVTQITSFQMSGICKEFRNCWVDINP